MDFLGTEGKAAAQAITRLCDKAASAVDVAEVRGLVVTANQTAANAQAITGKVLSWIQAIEGAITK